MCRPTHSLVYDLLEDKEWDLRHPVQTKVNKVSNVSTTQLIHCEKKNKKNCALLNRASYLCYSFVKKWVIKVL